MTIRIIIIDLDFPIGNKLYWFLKLVMDKYPDEIQDVKEQKTTRMNDTKALVELKKVREYYGFNRQGYNEVIKWLEGRIKRAIRVNQTEV